MHSKNVVHRDLKLDNILVDGNDNVKIIDYGFATSCNKNEKLSYYCGTPHYMDPDLIQKKNYYAHAADVWATGVILFILLSGKMPFYAEFEGDLVRRVQGGKFAWPRNFRQGSVNIEEQLSSQVKNLIKRIFEPNPELRLSAEQLLKEGWFNKIFIWSIK